MLRFRTEDRQRPVQAGGGEHQDQRPPGDLQVLDEVKAVQLGLALGESGQMPAFRRRRTALPMRAIERAVALEHPVNRRARGKLLEQAVLLQRQADRIGPVLAQDTVLTQRPTHAQNARFDIHAYAVPGATGLTVIKAHPVKTLAPCVLYPIGHRAHTHPILHCHGAHASPRANRSNHLVTTFRNRTFLAMAHLSKMPLGYGQETGAPTVQGPMPRCGDHCPSARCSTAAKFGTCGMILACGFVDESCGPARALRAVWTAYGQHPCCPQAAHTLGPLAHKLHRLNNKITESNDALTQSTLRVFN